MTQLITSVCRTPNYQNLHEVQYFVLGVCTLTDTSPQRDAHDIDLLEEIT